jgi:uncharacterized protein (DUF488 family)
MRLFTIGYEQRKSDEFFEGLKINRIKLLADIRAIAFSRRKEFSKTALSAKLAEMGIEYIHLRDLGGPKELRDKVRADGDYGFFFREYARYLDEQKEALETLIDLAGRKTACLLCYEKDVNRCHRRAVAERIRETSPKKFQLSHL